METTQQLKSDYLDAMGIEPWFPRAVLVNSLPPLQFSNESGTEPNTEPMTALQGAQPVQPQESLTHESGTDSTVEPRVTKPDADQLKNRLQSEKTEAASYPKNHQVRPVRFGLGLYVFGDWLVASSLVHDHALYQDQAISLAGNIIKTIEAESLPLKYHHVISWPFFANANADQGAEAARQYVSGVIDHLKENHHTSKLLAFGGVLPKLQGWSLSGKINDSTDRLILPSLYKMMDEPELKARAWREIQDSPFYSVK